MHINGATIVDSVSSSPSLGADMVKTTDPVELAFTIAQIACDTSEPDTAMRLLDLADQLLTAAGLPIIAPGQFADPAPP
jgi:hypothetical protein